MDKHNNDVVLVRGRPAAPPPQPREPAVLTFKQAVTAIFRSRRLLVATTALGTLAGGWIALGEPNSYLSVGTFLFRPGGEQIVIDPTATPTDRSPPRPLRGNAEAIVKSEEVLRRTVRRLGPEYILAPYSPRLDPTDRSGVLATLRGWIYSVQRTLHRPRQIDQKASDALLALEDNLEVEAPKATEVLQVRVRANDALRAQRILEVFMEEAQRRHVEVYSAQRSIQEVADVYEAARDAHAKATRALAGFLSEHGLQDFEADLAETQEEARAARAARNTLWTRIQTNKMTLAGLEDRLRGLSPTTTVTAIVPVPNARVPVLRDSIAKIETELLEKRGLLRPTDDLLKSLERRLRKLEKELAAELAKKVETRTETRDEPNQEYLATKQNIRQIELSLVVDEERLPGVEKRAAAAQKAAAGTTRLQGPWKALARRVERTREGLDDAERMLALARRKSELDRKHISSLAVLDKPSLPLVKEGPPRVRIVLGALLAGFLLGIVLVIIRALTDTTVRGVDDLEEVGTIRVLATIPNLDKTNVKRHESMRVTSWS